MKSIEIQKQIQEVMAEVVTATNLVNIKLCNQVYEKIEKADYRLDLNKTNYFTKNVISGKFKYKNTYSTLSLTVAPKTSLVTEIYDTANNSGELFWQLLSKYDYFDIIKQSIKNLANDVMKTHNMYSEASFSYFEILFSDMWDSFMIKFYFENPNQKFMGFQSITT